MEYLHLMIKVPV
jgi:hypothetical protein